jgi:hypothetical protein
MEAIQNLNCAYPQLCKTILVAKVLFYGAIKLAFSIFQRCVYTGRACPFWPNLHPHAASQPASNVLIVRPRKRRCISASTAASLFSALLCDGGILLRGIFQQPLSALCDVYCVCVWHFSLVLRVAFSRRERERRFVFASAFLSGGGGAFFKAHFNSAAGGIKARVSLNSKERLLSYLATEREQKVLARKKVPAAGIVERGVQTALSLSLGVCVPFSLSLSSYSRPCASQCAPQTPIANEVTLVSRLHAVRRENRT